MSIVASVKVYDGIVIGAESMTQLFANVPGNPQPVCIKAYSHARKIFQVGRLGILTFGGGNIGNRSIESFVETLRPYRAFRTVLLHELRNRELKARGCADVIHLEQASTPFLLHREFAFTALLID